MEISRDVVAASFIYICFASTSIRINKVNRIIGTISIWRDIIVLFCKRVLLKEDGGGRVVEPCAIVTWSDFIAKVQQIPQLK